MLKSSFKIQKLIFLCFILFCSFSAVSVYGGETPSVPGTKVYFINLVVYGMPRKAVEFGAVDEVKNLEGIVKRLIQLR